MLSEEALALLQATAIDAAGVKRVTDAQVPTVAIPRANGGIELTSIEHLMFYRSRFRGTYATNLMGEFTRHIVDRGGGDVFVDADARNATAIYNLGNTTSAGHADDKAVLTLKPTAEYAAVLAIVNSRHGQREVAEWLEDWRHNVTVWDGGATENVPAITLPAAVAAIRNLTVQATQKGTSVEESHRTSRGTFEEVETKSDIARLPTGFFFAASPYEGFMQRTFSLRLSIITSDKPTLQLRFSERDVVEEAIALEFRDKVTASAAGSKVYVGTFKP